MRTYVQILCVLSGVEAMSLGNVGPMAHTSLKLVPGHWAVPPGACIMLEEMGGTTAGAPAQPRKAVAGVTDDRTPQANALEARKLVTPDGN